MVASAARDGVGSRTIANPPHIIGWKESVSFPDWGIAHVSAKADTGARGCALDVRRVVELADGRLQFEVILDRGSGPRTQTVVARMIGHTRVRSSNGVVQERYRVETRVRIGRVVKRAEFSLTTRRQMIHRVLLGRRFLAGTFLVDSEKTYLATKRRKTTVRDPEEE